MLWRVRTTLADRPGALAALALRCGSRDVNILGLQIFPDGDTVTDEVVLRVPDAWVLADVAELAALVAERRGRPEEREAPEDPMPAVLPGGSPVVRVGQITDASAVVRMHARCSPDVLLQRYHVPMPRPTWRSARRLLSPPGGGSLLAVVGGEVVGMVVVTPYQEGVMEVGVLVEDRWQRAGVGSALLHQAARFAVGHGATDLLCSMRPENRSLLSTVQRSGLTCRLRAAAGAVEVRIPLGDVPPMDLGAVGADQVAVPVSTEA
jgi:GNAT superfamily N-acetyltransferase